MIAIPRGKRRACLTLILCCGLLGLDRTAYAQETTQVVSTVIAHRTIWQPTFEAVGNLRARWGADLAFQTAGIVSELDFHSGQDVDAGTKLARLQLNDEPGLLAEYQAQADLDQIVFNRDTRQYQVQAVSKATVDHDRLTLQADHSRAVAEQGVIGMKTLRAPFSGRLGVRRVDPGQYLQPGTVVVTLQALDPIYVDFYVPQNMSAYLKEGSPVTVTVDAWPGHNFAGAVTAVTPQVDVPSRTILVRARLGNHDHALVPGMFAIVRLMYGVAARQITIPKSAVTFSTFGTSVWTVQSSGDHKKEIVRQTAVVTGESRGDQVEVLSGLTDGQKIVSAGQIKLYEGAPVTENNIIQPDASADPHPPQE
ncbi:efflux RND transporter periplasmic adaptor subunit [Nguyenibacter vanlangensis]|uniref:Efflux RND transporter periplasmic adaptor subunit n=1 Tax=Nguyenibacter vanlangensis TaxID=1216886 RepID=A0ABZ3DAX8_9PROT